MNHKSNSIRWHCLPLSKSVYSSGEVELFSSSAPREIEDFQTIYVLIHCIRSRRAESLLIHEPTLWIRPRVSMAEDGNAVVNTSEQNAANDGQSLVRREQRAGDVISPHRAVLTLSKSMFNAGCFSLPYAWKLGGLWVSFVLSFVIAGFNWYGNHILVRSSQHLAQKSERSALDYGHFAKKVCDYSTIPFLNRNSKIVMYIVNVTILFYQLGMCSVAILFISDNMVHLLGDYFPGYSDHAKMVIMATISLVFIMATNMFTEMRVVSAFAMISSVFFVLGAFVVMQFAIRQESQWERLPASTDFTGTIMYIGMAMYAFEGQTMILPVENKLETPEDFLNNFGVLPTTMILCSVFMTGFGFYGYTGFGDNIAPTITTNVPKDGFYSVVNIFLMIQSALGHSIAMYVVFDMFYNGFQRKFRNRFPNCSKQVVDKGFRVFWVFLTYLMAVLIPKLEIMIPLVGVSSGTLCALVYPPAFEMITFWDDWKVTKTKNQRILKIAINSAVIMVGFFAIGAGLYANAVAIGQAFGA